MGLFDENPLLLRVARTASARTGAPVLGGIAVFLHGYRRTTADVDLFVHDPFAARDALIAIGGVWDAARRAVMLEGIEIHFVTAAQTGRPPTATVTIEEIGVISLPDLIEFKLRTGLNNIARAKDLADVVELIRVLGLTKDFAPKLPKDQREPFKRLVDAVQADEQQHFSGDDPA